MKFSIITVCYNAAETIEKTIKSVISQTNTDYEYIIIDGLSKDGTTDIIDKYKDKVTRFVSEKDNGIYDAMNKGISLAKGDFLLFLNADDELNDTEVLENISKIIDANPDSKIVFGDVEFVSENDETEIGSFEKIENDFDIVYNNICHQTIFYKRELFEEYGYYSDEYKLYADLEFNIRCLVKHKVKAVYVPMVVSKFKVGGVSSQKKYKQTCKIERKKIIKKYYPKSALFIVGANFIKKNFKSIYNLLARIKFSKLLPAIYKLNLSKTTAQAK